MTHGHRLPLTDRADWASLVCPLVIDKEDRAIGIVLIIDPQHSTPLWKLPGGKRQDDEFPHTTAKRELIEETGLDIPSNDLILLERKFIGGLANRHERYLYKIKIPKSQCAELRTGNDGEEPKLHSLQEFEQLIYEHKLVPPHLALLTKHRKELG